MLVRKYKRRNLIEIACWSLLIFCHEQILCHTLYASTYKLLNRKIEKFTPIFNYRVVITIFMLGTQSVKGTIVSDVDKVLGKWLKRIADRIIDD